MRNDAFGTIHWFRAILCQWKRQLVSMKMTDFCEVHREDWSSYALGNLSPSVHQEMAGHLGTGCLECAKRFVEAQVAITTRQLTDGVRDPIQTFVPETGTPPSVERRWKFWSVAPWALAALFFGLFVVAELARLSLQKQILEQRQLNPMTNHLVRETHQPPAANPANTENDQDLQATIEQLRGSLDQANQQIADAQRDTVRFQTDLKTAQLQIAAQQNGLKDSEQRRVKAEADAASIQMQLEKAANDARRAASLSAQNQQMMKLLESPQLRQLPLRAVSAAAGDATARVVWDNERGLLLLAHGLPELADNHIYQLWILRNGRPSMANAGVVQLDSRGRGVVYLPPGDDLNDMAGVAVTDEPSGGNNTTSRGSQVLIGKL